MENTGYVTERDGEFIKVRVDRESSCGGNCKSCNGCPTGAIVIKCRTADDVNIGDEVRLVMPTRSFFKDLFFGYGQIVIWMVLGAVLGFALFKTETASVIGTVVGIVLGLVVARVFALHKKDDMVAYIKDKG